MSRRGTKRNFIVPDDYIEYMSDDNSNKSKKSHNLNWDNLCIKYKRNKKILTLINKCKQYEESLEITEDDILQSNLPPYLITLLLRLYQDMISKSRKSSKYHKIREKISFYINKGVPKGPLSAFTTNENNIKLISQGFDKIRNSFPSFEIMPEQAVDLITLYKMDPYVDDHTEMIKKLNSLAKSNGYEIKNKILLHPDVNIRQNLLSQYQNAIGSDQESRDKIFSAIKFVLELPTQEPHLEVNKDILNNTYKILEHEIYGMNDIKLTLMANLESIMTKKKSCIALVGPPGVGKTSILQSLGKALGRPLFKISMAGTEVHNLKGGSRIYVGSGIGKIAQAFHSTKTKAPIIFLDELEKMNRNTDSSMTFFISELLDQTQDSIEDNFLNVPIDISRVLFVISMNSISTLDDYLLDRMLIMNVNPPNIKEKVDILYNMKLHSLLQNLQLHNKVILDLKSIEHIVLITNNHSGLRMPLKILDTVLKKLRLFIQIGSDHDIVPINLRGFKLPFHITPNVIDTLWSIQTEDSNYKSMYT